MTYPSTGGHDPSVPAGGTDTSDRFGPYITGSGEGVATQPGYLTSTMQDGTYPIGPSAAGIEIPRAVFHDGNGYVAHADVTADTANLPPTSDTDRDDGLPDVPRYEGPSVPDQPALVNPSAGMQGPVESGMTDINPQGPAPRPGTGPVSDRVVYPDTTQGNPR